MTMLRRCYQGAIERLDLGGHHYALSAARIGFFLVAFLDWGQLYLNRHVSFRAGDSLGPWLLLIELALMLLIAAGLLTRLTCALSFALLLKLDLAHMLDHYHLDYAVYNYAFIFLVAPAPRVWSIDSFIAARRGRPRRLDPIPAWFTLLFFLGLELVYFDSLFFKKKQVVWMQGLAFWMPAALPHFSAGRFPEWAEVGWLLRGASYFAFAVEIVFPLALFAKLRRPLALAAMGLHLGIAVFFPIPFFGLGVCALLLYFLVPGPRARGPEAAAESTRGRRLGAAAGWALCGLMSLGQVAHILQTHYGHLAITGPLTKLMKWPNKLMGLYAHGVYVDWHFQVPAPLPRFVTEVDGEAVAIPCFGEEGYPERSGRYWVMTTFFLRQDLYRASQPRIGRYLKGWFWRRGLEPREVRVEYKRLDYPLALDFAIDDGIRAEPWREAGRLRPDGKGRMLAEWTPRFEVERRGLIAALGLAAEESDAASGGAYLVEHEVPGLGPGELYLLCSEDLQRSTSVAVIAGGRVVAERVLGAGVTGARFEDAPGGEYRVVERPDGAPRLVRPRLVDFALSLEEEAVLRSGARSYPLERFEGPGLKAERQDGGWLIAGPAPARSELVAFFVDGRFAAAVGVEADRVAERFLAGPGGASLRAIALGSDGKARELALGESG